MTAGFAEASFEFLAELEANNDCAWFEPRRDESRLTTGARRADQSPDRLRSDGMGRNVGGPKSPRGGAVR